MLPAGSRPSTSGVEKKVGTVSARSEGNQAETTAALVGRLPSACLVHEERVALALRLEVLHVKTKLPWAWHMVNPREPKTV